MFCHEMRTFSASVALCSQVCVPVVWWCWFGVGVGGWGGVIPHKRRIMPFLYIFLLPLSNRLDEKIYAYISVWHSL